MAAIGSRILAPIAVSLALFFIGVQSAAFEISGSKWKGGKTDFYVSLTGESPSGIARTDLTASTLPMRSMAPNTAPVPLR